MYNVQGNYIRIERFTVSDNNLETNNLNTSITSNPNTETDSESLTYSVPPPVQTPPNAPVPSTTLPATTSSTTQLTTLTASTPTTVSIPLNMDIFNIPFPVILNKLELTDNKILDDLSMKYKYAKIMLDKILVNLVQAKEAYDIAITNNDNIILTKSVYDTNMTAYNSAYNMAREAYNNFKLYIIKLNTTNTYSDNDTKLDNIPKLNSLDGSSIASKLYNMSDIGNSIDLGNIINNTSKLGSIASNINNIITVNSIVGSNVLSDLEKPINNNINSKNNLDNISGSLDKIKTRSLGLIGDISNIISDKRFSDDEQLNYIPMVITDNIDETTNKITDNISKVIDNNITGSDNSLNNTIDYNPKLGNISDKIYMVDQPEYLPNVITNNVDNIKMFTDSSNVVYNSKLSENENISRSSDLYDSIILDSENILGSNVVSNLDDLGKSISIDNSINNSLNLNKIADSKYFSGGTSSLDNGEKIATNENILYKNNPNKVIKVIDNNLKEFGIIQKEPSIIWKTVKKNKYDCIASNNTGKYMIMCDFFSYYLSSDFGYSWVEYKYPKSADKIYNNFTSIASDGTGKFLIACSNNKIYTSSDFGTSWTLSFTPITTMSWSSVTSDSTGQYLAACATPVTIESNMYTKSGVYTSQDFGKSWVQSSIPNNIYLNSIKSSINGKYLFVGGGSINDNKIESYISSDYGITWSKIPSLKNITHIVSVAINYDGTILIGASSNRGLYLFSNSSWKEILLDIRFNSVSSDTTGKYLVASGPNGIYESSDYGSSWVLSYETKNNDTIILSTYSGKIMIASNWDGLYIGTSAILPFIDFVYPDITISTKNIEEDIDILTLINNSDLFNPSEDFKLKLSKISKTDLNDLFTKNQLKVDNLVPLIELLNNEQVKSIVNLLNQKQLNTILLNTILLNNNKNFMIILENINKEQIISIGDKNIIKNLIIGLVGMKIKFGKEAPSLKYITIEQFNLLIDNDFINFINYKYNQFFFSHYIKQLSKIPDLILINHIINLLSVIKKDIILKMIDQFFPIFFDILYLLLTNHFSLINNKFDHLLLSITPEQIKLLDLSIIDNIYDLPFMNKLSKETQYIIKSLNIKFIPPIQLPDSYIIWTTVKRNNFRCIATNSTGQYIIGCDKLIHKSEDFGKSWLEYEYPSTFKYPFEVGFVSIASNGDGKNLIATSGINIYISIDFGTSWKISITPTNGMWQSVTCDTTGKYLAICSTQEVCTSEDYGTTWILRSLPNSKLLNRIQSNITGNYLVVTGIESFISSDHGVSWISMYPPNPIRFKEIMISDKAVRDYEFFSGLSELSELSGLKPEKPRKTEMILNSIAINNDRIFMIATFKNYGNLKSGLYLSTTSNYRIVLPNIEFDSVSSDKTCKYIVASGPNGIYESSDYGYNWILSYDTKNNNTIILSNYNGNQIIATNANGLHIGRKQSTSLTTLPSLTTSLTTPISPSLTTSPTTPTSPTQTTKSFISTISNTNIIIIISIGIILIFIIMLIVFLNT